MKTKIVNLVGDHRENLYQLGLKERESFQRLEARVSRLLSTNALIRIKNDILIRVSTRFKKREPSYFLECIEAYAEGLGIDAVNYLSFVSSFEVAAHYGKIYPELKGLLPGCTSVFHLDGDAPCHSRLVDFSLIGIFEATPRLYYWKLDGKPTVLNYSCEGLAPFFFQALHESGTSMAIHHKPGKFFHEDGRTILELSFDLLFGCSSPQEIRKEARARTSMTKWGLLLLGKEGRVTCIDIDGPNTVMESFDLEKDKPLIFTNLPLRTEAEADVAFAAFCQARESWLRKAWSRKGSLHPLDVLTDVTEKNSKSWSQPCATLNTTGAVHLNLGKGFCDVKEGSSALVRADAILRLDLATAGDMTVARPAEDLSAFEEAWKWAAESQSAFDQGDGDRGYHLLQMAETRMPHPIWKQVFSFYLYLWDFRFVTSARELSLIYKKVKALKLPAQLTEQWLLFCGRLERHLHLMLTVDQTKLSLQARKLLEQEWEASRPVFLTWMKGLYPKIETLDVLAPHQK